jgi:hypothetical protein
MSTLTLYLPGLLPVEENLNGPMGENLEMDCPALAKLLCRGTHQRSGTKSREKMLKSFFKGLSSTEIPSGALSALRHGLIDKLDPGIWCYASPIECAVDNQMAYILGNAHLELSEEERAVLSAEINQLLQQDGHTLYAPSSGEWLCKMANSSDIVMNDLIEVLAKNLGLFLPSGPDQLYWRRLFTECQMLLASSKVNAQRSAQQKPIISALWFWGMGALPQKVSTHFSHIYTKSSTIYGLGLLANIVLAELPQQFCNSMLGSSTQVLVADMQSDILYSHQFYDEWLKRLYHYEEYWFRPILKAFSDNQLETLLIYYGKGYSCKVTKRNLKYFWRLIKPLKNVDLLKNN